MTELRRTFVQCLRVLALTLIASGSAFATTVSTDPQVDPPGRVGRIADLQGQVWLYHPADGDWIDAERNRPLTSGDRLATEAGGRADVRIGSTTLRLDSGTELEVLRLDDDRIALQLHNGSVAARLRSRETVPEFELRTGEGRFTVQRTGRYRFDRADETSQLTVYSGQALYEGQGSALSVNAGQRAEFWIDNANIAQYSIVEPLRDAFAGWNAERDRAEDRSAATRYVSPEMTGVEDLDRYGSWQDDAEYGTLWVPRTVAPGWAPYSVGRWAWVAPWGWTWVDEAPWGFAPFHYGRWVYASSRWCWSPGHYVRRPVYAPALVAWIASPALSVGVGAGPTIGWLPLAPREVFVPSYRVSPGYVRNVNITHVVNITNVTTIVNNPQQAVDGRDFRNRKFPHALTVVPATTLSARAPVAPAARPFRDAPTPRENERGPLREATLVAPPPSVAAPPPARATPGQGVPRSILPMLRRDGRERADIDQPRTAPAAPPAPAIAAPREVQREVQRDLPRGVPREVPRQAPGEVPHAAPPRQATPAPAPAPAPVAVPPREERRQVAPPAPRERRENAPPAAAPAPREPKTSGANPMQRRHPEQAAPEPRNAAAEGRGVMGRNRPPE